MKICQKFLIVIILLSLSKISSYTFTQTTCKDNRQQSPININLADTVYSESDNFRVLTNDFKPLTSKDKWQYFSREQAVGVSPADPEGDFGGLLLVKSWSIYNFILKKVLFRVSTENLINNERINTAEMQLIFELNANYYTPGKRKFLDVNNLVISLPFRTNNTNKPSCRLFEFMNLKKFADSPSSTVTMSRNVKLHQIIVHQPALMYKGSMTFPDCEDALWIINTDYHFISSQDFNNLVKVTRNFMGNDNANIRDIQNKLPTTRILRNFKGFELYGGNINKLHYNNGTFNKFGYFGLILIIFLL